MNPPGRSLRILAVVAGLCSACAKDRPVSSDVRTEEIAASAEARYAMAADKKYVPPALMGEVAEPLYPADLLASRLGPRTVVARVVVDETGAVFEVTPVSPIADPIDARFFEAVEAACRSWRYAPYIEVSDTAIEIPNDDGTVTVEYPSRALPFHLDYAFTFSQREGKAIVERGAL